jgi:Concanavalin A-like lectin/glucanases superfamily
MACVLACAAILAAAALVPSYASAANARSYDFEASANQSLSVADAPQFDLRSDFTIEAWVKFESTPAIGAQYTFVSKNQGSGDQRAYEFILFPTATESRLGLNLSTDGVDGNFRYVIWSPEVDTWYHLAATYDQKLGEVRIYVDGVQLGNTQTDAPTSVLFNSSSDLYIGSNPQGDAFDGKIDEVVIWNKVRPENKIAKDLMREYDEKKHVIAYWSFDDGLDDSSGNNALTINNGVALSTDTFCTSAVSTSNQKLLKKQRGKK